MSSLGFMTSFVQYLIIKTHFKLSISMKNINFGILLLLLSLLKFSTVTAQVQFETFSSFDKALVKAKKDKKLIFVQIASPSCVQCNDVGQKGLSSPALKEKFDINFISLSIKFDDEIYKQIITKTNLGSFSMGSLFLDNDGYVLQRLGSTSSSPIMYLEIADKAIALSKNNTLKELDMQYAKGERNKDLLKKLIQEKSAVNFETYHLVDEYINLNNINELSTIDNARLMIEQGLPLNGKARKILYALFTTKTIDSLFFTYSLEQRIKINSRVISSTRNIAKKDKDRNLAMQLSSFITSTYAKEYEKGRFYGQSYLNNFYKDIKDTTNFLQNAQSFCDYTLMSLSVDTLKKREEKERNTMFTQRRQSQGVNGITSFSYTSHYLKYAEELNNISFDFFKYTNDLEKLVKALKWSKRAIDIYEALSPDESIKQNSSMMDTYACLLYRLGKKDEAIEWETKAIDNFKKLGFNTSNLESTLNKIKTGVL